LGGRDIANPPWVLKFLFTRDIGEDFETALASIPPLVEQFGNNRDFVWRNFMIKLSNPDRYYLSPHHRTRDRLTLEIIENVDATGGFFLFDTTGNSWVRVSSSPVSYTLSDLLDSALLKTRSAVRPPFAPDLRT
jgi:hypothetical protein